MTGMVAIIAVLCVALALPGVINRTRAWFSGRKGIRFGQHISNVRTMLRKGVVVGRGTTWITRTAPSVCLGASFTALLFIPVGGIAPLLHFEGDIVVFAYILALGRFALILAAMDAGSSFEGMGASREALYGAMAEPALFVVAGTLALVSSTTSFADMFHGAAEAGISPEMVIVFILLAYVTLRILTVECGRVPIDDPRTHLELTMIHEVMILDYSGVDLAMITVAGWFKMAALAFIASDTVAVIAGTGWYSALVSVALALVIAFFVGFTESFRARNKLSRNTTYIFTILAIAFVLFIIAYLLKQNINLV